MNNLIVKLNFDTPNYFYVNGSLTHETCMHLAHEINTHLNSFIDKVTLDISNLEHLDGSGMGVIITLAVCLLRQRKRLIIILPNYDSQPKQLIKYFKFNHILEIR